MSATLLPLKGGCLCGALRYEVRGRPFMLTACHCLDCQKRTDSAYSMNLQTPTQHFVVMAGEPIEAEMPTPSGSTTTHLYCAACYCRIASKPNAQPGVIAVRPGTLDDTRWVAPVVHLFARSALPGAIPAGAASAETMPEDWSPHMLTFERVWAGRSILED